MNKREFLNGLREALSGEVSDGEIRSQLDYYSHYIEEQIRSGRNEAEVLASLGDPRLIAKTIIETSDGGEYINSSSGYERTEQQQEHGQQQQQAGGSGMWFGGKRMSPWLGLLVVILLVMVVVAVLTSLVSLLAPILIPLLIIFAVISFFTKNRG